MALEEIVDIISRTEIQDDGTAVQGKEVSFTTEETSGTHDIFIPDTAFTRQEARTQAEDAAEEIDATIAGPSGE